MYTTKALFFLFATLFFAVNASPESLRGIVEQQQHQQEAEQHQQGRDLQTIGSGPPFPAVSIYEHWNYQGERLTLAVGSFSYYQLLGSRLGNDRASSFTIVPGFKLIACVHNFSWCYTFAHDTPRLYALNDAFSSFIVIKA